MRHSRRNGLIAAVVAGGGLAVAGVGGLAHADADAAGTTQGSPGLLSGNLVQLPVDVPVNACGNTVSIVGVLNPAAGNRCANGSRGGGGEHPEPRPAHGQGPASSSASTAQAGGVGGAVAQGGTQGSPGLLTGNGLQLPVQLPANVSGNSVNVVGIGNPSTGNSSVNGQQPPTVGKPPQPPVVQPPVVEEPTTVPPAPPKAPVTPAPPRQVVASLAHTGADGAGYLLPGGGALLLGGVLLYRRFRTG